MQAGAIIDSRMKIPILSEREDVDMRYMLIRPVDETTWEAHGERGDKYAIKFIPAENRGIFAATGREVAVLQQLRPLCKNVNCYVESFG